VVPIDPGKRESTASDERSIAGRSLTVAARVGAGFKSLVREPVVVVLVLAGVVDALSGSPWSHGAMLVAVAALLVVDRIRRSRTGRAADGSGVAFGAAATPPSTEEGEAGPSGLVEVTPRVRFTPLIVVGGVLYAGIVGLFARHSWPVTVAVAIPGIAAVTLAWREPALAGYEPPRLEPSGAVAWATVFILLGLWELANLLMQPSITIGSSAHPTISVLMDPILASHVGRSILLALWLGFGAFLMER
jgi:hypothetical protein